MLLKLLAQWYLLLDLKVVKRKFSWFLPNCYCARFLEGKKSHDALLPTREEEQESVALKSETLKPILMKYFPFSKYIFQELPFSRKRKKLIVKIELWLNQVNHEKLSIYVVYQTFEKVNLMKPKNDSDPWNSTATAIESKD